MLRRGRLGKLAVAVGCVGGGALLSGAPACGGKLAGADADGGSHVATSGTGHGGAPLRIPIPGLPAGGSGSSVSPAGGKPGAMTGGTTGGATQLGQAGVSAGGSPSVLEGGAPAAGGGDNGSCNAGGASPACDFGLPCARDSDCAERDCYIPGSQQNPICSKSCATSADCPRGSACTGPFGDGSHCFLLCDEAAQCLAINDAPENPLDCVDMADPRAPQGQTVCAQYSEP